MGSSAGMCRVRWHTYPIRRAHPGTGTSPSPLSDGHGVSHRRRPLWVKGCRCDYVDSTSGVPQIAADLSRRPTRQPWAKSRHPNAASRTRNASLRRDVRRHLAVQELVRSAVGSTGPLSTTGFKRCSHLDLPAATSVRFSLRLSFVHVPRAPARLRLGRSSAKSGLRAHNQGRPRHPRCALSSLP
jgi:hypothetical protein